MGSSSVSMQTRRRAVLDIAVVIVVSGVVFALELAAGNVLPWGEEARGVGAVLAGAAAAIWLTRARGGRLADLGFRQPRRWSTVPLWALGIFFAFVAGQVLVPALLAPFFDLPTPDLSRYDVIRGNLPAALAFALLLPLTASIPEEILYRGFLIERLESAFGAGRGSAALAVLVQAVIFGSVHFQWGVGGILVTVIMGAVWGFAFLACGRNLWIVIIAHSTGHLAMVAQLYFAPPPA
jgi:membrane protease YdiL (CAAX protease family)